MPVIMTKTGPVFIDGDPTPDVIARITAQHGGMGAVQSAPAAKAPAPLSADQQEVQRRVNDISSKYTGVDQYARKFGQGMFANFADELSGGVQAATRGVVHAFQKGDIGEVGKEYRIARDTERQLDQRAEQQTGTGGTLAEIAGALVNPIGDGAKALEYAGKAVPLLGKVGAKIAGSNALVKGALAGANQGAVNAVGSDDSAQSVGDLVNRAGQGWTTGGLVGGAFGGAATGARKVVQVLADRGAPAAERVAYSRIGGMLKNAKLDPALAEKELADANASGGDAVVADLSPGLQAQAGALAKKPNVPGSNDMIARSRDRLDDRNTRFENEVRNRIALANGDDAAAHMEGLTAARKGAGNVDYQQALDGKFHWDQNLQDFMDKADPEMHDAMRQGAHLASLHGQDVAQLGYHIDPATGKTVIDSTTPSLRVFDYAKRAMDDKISRAMKAGDSSYAGGLSNLLSTFKQHVMNAAPDYAPALAKQRDYFQRADATQKGLDFISRMRSSDPLTGPQSILKEIDQIKATNPGHLEDIRTGMANAILGTSNKADPRAFLMQSARNPDQRKILEFAFGGQGPFNDFVKWANRDARSTGTDKLVAPGYQSATELFRQGGESLGSDVGGLAEHTGRGFGFGGPVGAAAGFLRKFGQLASTMSPEALDAMAKALMSNGGGLAEKVGAANKFGVERAARNAKWAKGFAKAGQQTPTDFTGAGN